MARGTPSPVITWRVVVTSTPSCAARAVRARMSVARFAFRQGVAVADPLASWDGLRRNWRNLEDLHELVLGAIGREYEAAISELAGQANRSGRQRAQDDRYLRLRNDTQAKRSRVRRRVRQPIPPEQRPDSSECLSQ